MQLYHFSDRKLSTLEPRIGERRQSAEDNNAKDTPVIWLTDSPYRAPGVESLGIYRHTVEIDSNHPSLYKDSSKESLKAQWNQNFAEPDEPIETIYYCTIALSVVNVDECSTN